MHCFENLYNSGVQNNVFPEVVCKNQISACGKVQLNEDISMDEVKIAAYSIGVDKAPCPDGFTSIFFQNYWDKLKYNLHYAMKSSFAEGKIIRQINHTFLSMVPKKTPPNSMSDYRATACCNFTYKVLAKISVTD